LTSPHPHVVDTEDLRVLVITLRIVSAKKTLVSPPAEPD
jgi:hypothetical protein